MSNNSEEKERVNVLVVDDHTLFAEGTVSLLSFELCILVVGIAKNEVECMDLVRKTLLDVVLLDINLPGTCGINLIAKIIEVQPKVKIIMLTGQSPQGYVAESISKGANGFLLKDCSAKEMIQAILRVSEGGIYFPQSLESLFESKNISKNLNIPLGPKTPNKLLTAREIEIMKLVSKGLHNKEIASVLSIKVRTVDFHISNILFNFGVSSRLEAVLMWMSSDSET